MIFKKINKIIKGIEIDSIPEERKEILQPLIDYIQNKMELGENVNLNFICTHNSRRSHLAQIWAQTIASFFNINNVFCFSGGTEATALYASAKETLERIGFVFEITTEEENPHYQIFFSDEEQPLVGFSKTYDHASNPSSNFAAIMTCSHADENCPFIAGAEKRIPITYEDPKKYDNTSKAKKKYKERSLQIAAELYYVFSKID
jgi:arsenate reductase